MVLGGRSGMEKRLGEIILVIWRTKMGKAAALQEKGKLENSNSFIF